MDINNLIQTLIFMNLKDISNMSYMELFPIVLFGLIFSHKEDILDFVRPYLTWNKYKSQIVNEISISYDKDGDLKVKKTASISVILWYYRKSVDAIKSSNIVKEYRLNTESEKAEDGFYLRDIYIPDSNISVKLDKDIYLEFKHSNKTVKSDKENSTDEKIITLILKSKTMDSNSLKEWFDNISESYSKWRKAENLWLFTSRLDEKINLDFSSFIFDSTKSFDNLFFEQKETIINRLKQYSDNERYKKLGIPHTLGFLFYGEPGCGKTSCIKAIANHLQRSIVTINLKHVKDIKELTTLFLSRFIGSCMMLERSKRIYVFEEVDCCVEDKDNPFLDRALQPKKETKEEDKLDKLATVLLKDEKAEIKPPSKITTGEVLELLDGIAETDDRIIIFTTNHPEKIDKAFMRPGRIDVCIEFKKLRRVDINNLYKLWFGKDIGEKALNKIKDYSLSQAEFGKLCFENNAEKVLEKLICG
jgi:hypothetical protein